MDTSVATALTMSVLLTRVLSYIMFLSPISSVTLVLKCGGSDHLTLEYYHDVF